MSLQNEAKRSAPTGTSTSTTSEDDHEYNRKNNSEQQQQQQTETFCSVLNVVIDHTMEPPLAEMEPEEDKENNNNNNGQAVLVPVIRVFGPVLKGGSHQPPTQSACLYIHGAFPYLLARPVIAGPDGSMTSMASSDNNDSTTTTTHINWDDIQAVERVVPHITMVLEESLQSMDFGRDNNQNNKTPNNSRFIRKVSVVQGRGFYTYCPGPPAPFLRVEYYNPQLRWKVKLQLERGLELPLLYHPDPLQYQRPISNNMHEEQPSSETLSFHCYEAHIPYTMQFFKDWNLAGMSYIHLQKGKVRGKLPVVGGGGSVEEDAASCPCLYQSNTPARYIWQDANKNATKPTNSTTTPLPLHQPSSPSQTTEQTSQVQQPPQHQPPPKKETCCQVEIDCTVHDILNVHNVLTTMPSEQDERDRIQWRAVPSLQEIWRQERRRMAKLLPPQHDFLSHPGAAAAQSSSNTNSVSTSQETNKTRTTTQQQQQQHPAEPPPFTLNVKKDASKPGARLACKGMWSLVNVTHGLEEDFKRSLTQIIQRHQLAVTRVDDQLLFKARRKKLKDTIEEENQDESKSSKASSELLQLMSTDNDASNALGALADQSRLTPTNEEAIHALGALADQDPLTPTNDEAIHALGALADQDQLTPTNNEAIDALLGALADQGPLTPTNNEAIDALGALADQGPLTPTNNEAIDALGALADEFGGDGDLEVMMDSSSTPFSNRLETTHAQYSQTSSASLPRCYSSSQELHDGTQSAAAMDPAIYSQRVERGDSIVDGPCHDLEDYIDPETLLPYEDLYFGQDRCLALFSIVTDPPETQRVCGGPTNACPRDGHDQAIERAKPGYYKTVTTGMCVDGILASSDDNDYDEEEDDDNGQFEQVLSVLATQTFEKESTKSTSGSPSWTSNNMDFFSQQMPATSTQHSQMFGQAEHPSSMDLTDGESEQDDHKSVDDSSSARIRNRHGTQDHEGNTGTPSSTQWDGRCQGLIMPTAIPPTRSEISQLGTDRRLHGLEPSDQVPTWLKHSSRYTELYQHVKDKKAASKWFPTINKPGRYIQPVSLPPSSRTVSAWHKRKFGRSSSKKEDMSKEKNPSKKSAQGNRSAVDELEIDGNSRKLILRKRKAIESTDATDSSSGAQNVEEVQWEASQLWQLTPSQLTPNEETPHKRGLQAERKSQGTPTSVKSSSQQATSLEILRRDCQDSPLATKRSSQGVGIVEKPQNGDIEDMNVMGHHSKSMDPNSLTQSESQVSEEALEGLGNQGGRIHVQGGGGLKAKTRPSQGTGVSAERAGGDSNEDNMGVFLPAPLSFMAVEIHVQCRSGGSRLDARKIAMTPDSNKDRVFAIVFIFGKDPGGGESLQIEERGCVFVPLETETTSRDDQILKIRSSMPPTIFGISAPLTVECVKDEKNLLLRLASIVRLKNPDMLLSWDTQGAGLGYLIERGVALGEDGRSEEKAAGNEQSQVSKGVDLVRLLGRTPHDKTNSNFLIQSNIAKDSGAIENETAGNEKKAGREEGKWKGSGLGGDWDERVGAGAAAASIVGRLVFAGWKIVSEEVKHANASYLPAVVSAVLNKRIPHHDELTLTQWYAYDKGRERWRVLHHRLSQAVASLLLFDALDIIGRAGEAARLSGVEFSQSFPGIRGSQYKVEGVLLRALQSLRSDERGAKKGLRKKGNDLPGCSSTPFGLTAASDLSEESKSQTQSPWKIRRGISGRDALESEAAAEHRQYFFFSPSLQDTNRQEALEVQALTLEPRSGHYKDPVVVCDFTALYPSLVIAYNLCYSTCAGKLEYHSTRREMQLEGRTTGKLGPFTYTEGRTATVLTHHMKSLQTNGKTSNRVDGNSSEKDRAYISPTGTIYVSEGVVKGVLPQILDEMLTTRAMLKRAAKEYKKNVPNLAPAILRQLEARQLALKYVANVTYGYTSATFSGRCAMPLLADTIVECGRKTLRKAIDMVNRWGRESKKWQGCQVIYGDTDSLFVKLPGRSYKEAFEFGEFLCKRVTEDNPPPVQLKLEKVYLGSIMQTMKRYCGMKFESKDQKKPIFEAKGLETIRKDQCALTQKVLRNALITLFRSGVEAVKTYLYRQWSLIFAGQLPISDFILTGRVRSRYRGGREGPVQAVLARRISEADPGRVVRHKERLPYVIVATPGVTFRLKDCVLTPLELLERWDAYTIHSSYYIIKHVNASLQRCLGLAPHHVDISVWYQDCPKPRRRIHFWPVFSRSRAMITSYFGSDICSLCRRKCRAQGRARAVVCQDCQKDGQRASQIALLQLNQVQRAAQSAAKECSRCNHCFEDASTFAALTPGENKDNSSLELGPEKSTASLMVPIANCVCIDCPNTFERHRLRESEIESLAVCQALNLL